MIVPANLARWPDLQAVLGSANCHGRRCYCQRFKSPGSDWKNVSDEERAFRLRMSWAPAAGRRRGVL
ncbi:hypothetical protein ABH920_003865 [Catenulispora sp. EB89]